MGTAACRAKVEAVQPVLSLLVSETVKDTVVPGWTHWLWEGARVTVGFAGTQGSGPKLTWTAAPVVPVAAVVMVTAAAGSV